MRAFTSLSVAAQANRVRRLAEGVLPRFGLRANTPMRLLHHGENTTFRVDAPRKRCFNLRVHRPNYQSDSEIQSELLWLDALAHDTDLGAPKPVKGTNGRFLQHGSARGVPERRVATLLEWVPGRFLTRRASLAGHRRIGVLTAHLHTHTLRWRRPKRFVRRVWDADGLMGADAHFGPPLAAPGLPPSTRRLFERGIERLHADLSALGQDPEGFGLIHADLHLWNVVTQDGIACPIDFDDCGFGWWAYDWAVSMTPSLGHPRIEAAKQAWLEGYESVRPFPEEQKRAFDLMVTARAMAMLGWVASRSDNPRLRAYVPVRVGIARARTKAYFAGRPQATLKLP